MNLRAKSKNTEGRSTCSGRVARVQVRAEPRVASFVRAARMGGGPSGVRPFFRFAQGSESESGSSLNGETWTGFQQEKETV